eukprot:gnl/MRDRNA2_/MRDRNA2_465703_c0_seq1.p2 gnl/MRDRNA2_/MRDRNA2_465703_c0~~gnl/MRDRNA2_/MRDRNA2_465703_c0_seq1.p2  ORF type:complete len:121 (-),score=6.72 gnl/MRDRNA2_/MRDRNA2_465703_c0_seq1:144-506(-)
MIRPTKFERTKPVAHQKLKQAKVMFTSRSAYRDKSKMNGRTTSSASWSRMYRDLAIRGPRCAGIIIVKIGSITKGTRKHAGKLYWYNCRPTVRCIGHDCWSSTSDLMFLRRVPSGVRTPI